MIYIRPTVLTSKFTCPHCGAISLQRWDWRNWGFDQYTDVNKNPIRVARCDHCENFSLWLNETMLYPDVGIAPQPNPELPNSVKNVYSEAASISSKSPRGAAALLRLAVQVLCKELGEGGENINNDIANLVSKGLPKRVQQALDIVRVTGNNAVHPGQIDVDDPGTVEKLFELINVIAEYTISMPTRIKTLYDALPQTTRDQIEKRDKKI